VRRVGGRVERRVDVRVVAATNRDLRAEVAAGRFREDLFFRLAVAVVRVPPLRKRLDDLPELVRGLLWDIGQPNVTASESALAALRTHAWPGNIRELKNALACAAAFVDQASGVIERRHLRLLQASEDESAWIDSLPLGGHTLERIERAAIRQTLEQAKGNKASAARALGIALSTLYEKLKKYGF
jgi:DNA-binding NtrC family response regulator